MRIDQIIEITTSIQSLVTTIAILVGGAWVLFTFWDLKSYRKASSEIAEIEQRATFEAWASKQAMVSLKLKNQVLGKAENGKSSVSFEGVVQNNGKRSFQIVETSLMIERYPISSK